MSRTVTIGIIAGSGPEAGIDLWTKVLAHARRARGPDYAGDRDAPRVEIVSEPALGASMDLPATDAEVWRALRTTATALGERCDVYAIACNTLNVYRPRLEALDLPARLVAFPTVVGDWARAAGADTVGLLAARPVATLGEWSPYRELAGELAIETPPDPDGLHRLIAEVKATGPTPALRDRFRALAGAYAARDLLLACTELPLVAAPLAGRRLVDVTDLVAAELVRCWSDPSPG